MRGSWPHGPERWTGVLLAPGKLRHWKTSPNENRGLCGVVCADQSRNDGVLEMPEQTISLFFSSSELVELVRSQGTWR